MANTRFAALLLGAGAALGATGFGAGPLRAAEVPSGQTPPAQGAAAVAQSKAEEAQIAQAPQAGQRLAQANVQVAQGYVPEPVPYEQGKGFYATIGLGAQWPQQRSFDIDNTGIDGDVHSGGGFSGDIGLGYDFGAIRTELTYGYSRSSVSDISISTNRFGSGRVDASGNVDKNDVLLSAYWDIPTGSRWSPYVGGGIGYSNIGTPNIRVGGINTGGGNYGAFGYQAKLGVSYIASYNTDIFLEGVYQGATGQTVNDVDFGSFNSWGAKLGFRYRFAQRPVAEPVAAPAPAPRYTAPAPAPEPAPAPAPIRGLW